jgi:hypothetical protein
MIEFIVINFVWFGFVCFLIYKITKIESDKYGKKIKTI